MSTSLGLRTHTQRAPVPAGKPRILILARDDARRDELAEYLSISGLDVAEVKSIEDAACNASMIEPAVILIVASLPDREISQFIRMERSRHPYVGLILLADILDVVERVVALEMGVDDLIERSCRSREVLARIHRLLHRYPRPDPRATLEDPNRVSSRKESWELNLLTRTLTSPTGAVCDLPIHSVRLIELLVEKSRQEPLGGLEINDDNRIQLRTAVCRLRKRLQYARIREPIVQSIKGKGYKLCKEVRLVGGRAN